MAVSDKEKRELAEWIEQNGPVDKNTTPAVLLYFEDFLVGVSALDMEQRGQYITLLCLQNAFGHLSIDTIASVISGDVSPRVLDKFIQDEAGNWYNPRMEYEIYRRVKRSKTLANNLTPKRDNWKELKPENLKRPDLAGL